MSAPTEMELRRPEPDITPIWACYVGGCKEPVPADVEDQPRCESCHVPVCEVHVVTLNHLHICPVCLDKQRAVIFVMATEMRAMSRRMWDLYINPSCLEFDLNDVQATCERWMKEIGEVL